MVLRLIPVLITDQLVVILRLWALIGALKGGLTRIDGVSELTSSGTDIWLGSSMVSVIAPVHHSAPVRLIVVTLPFSTVARA